MNALIDYSGSSSDDDSDAEIEVPQDYAGPRVEQVDEPAGPAYPNTDGAYPDAYPDADAAYPNTDGAYPDTDGAYPNTDDAYPDTDGAYPDTDAAYPDTDAAYPDTDAQFAPARTFEVGAWRCAECQEEVKRIRYECPRCFAPRSERCLAYVSEDGVTRPLADLTLDPRVAATLPWAAWEDPATGARYYHNDATGESTWDEPADQYRPAERKPPCPDVPPGWVATWDVDAWAYYFFDAARVVNLVYNLGQVLVNVWLLYLAALSNGPSESALLLAGNRSNPQLLYNLTEAARIQQQATWQLYSPDERMALEDLYYDEPPVLIAQAFVVFFLFLRAVFFFRDSELARARAKLG